MYRKITQYVIWNRGRVVSPWQSGTTAPLSTETISKDLPQRYKKWDLYASVLVERLPVVSKGLNALERAFQEQLWRVEFENSLKSDFELKHERDLVQSELIKNGEMELDLDDSASKQTAQDLKDAYTEELKIFKFASRSTPDDAENITTSINRCLEDTLYLVIEETLGKQTHRLLPQGPRLEGETMRQAAERVLREKCGEQLQVHFFGNAPCGFYKYRYPSEMRQNSVGAKVFFYRATLQSGNVDKAVAKKYEWLDKKALEVRLTKSEYMESVEKLLL